MSGKHELRENRAGYHQSPRHDEYNDDCANSAKVLALWLLSSATLLYLVARMMVS